MSEQNPSIPPHPPLAANTPPKKGMSTGAKVGIGCGAAALVFMVIAAIGIWFAVTKVKKFLDNPEKTAAELIINNIPDLEAAEFNDEDQTVTVVYKKDGKTYTLDYKDAAEGKIILKDSDGNVITLGTNDTTKIPDWVPQPPGLSNTRVFYMDNSNGVSSGQYTATLTGPIEEIRDRLAAQLSAEGYVTRNNHVSTGDSGQWNLSGTKDKREISIHIYSSKDSGGITVVWKQK